MQLRTTTASQARITPPAASISAGGVVARPRRSEKGAAKGRGGLPAERVAPAGGPPEPGLVYSQTTHTRGGDGPSFVMVDTRRKRMKRLKHATITRARLLTQGLQRGGVRYRAAFVTLTYERVEQWHPGHVRAFMTHVRNWLGRRGHVMRGEWVAELQKRGAVHYHVLLFLPRGLMLPKPDKRGWWVHGMSNCKWARNAVGYIAKYASKGQETGQFPRGCRTHAGFGLTAAQRSILSWWMLPRAVRAAGHSGHRWVRAKGGGWLSRLTGEILPPTHKYAGRVGGNAILVPIAEYRALPPYPALSQDAIARALQVRCPNAADWCAPSVERPVWMQEWKPINDFKGGGVVRGA